MITLERWMALSNDPKLWDKNCPACGCPAISQLSNRIGIYDLGERTDARNIHWQCGHPLAPNNGCGHQWAQIIALPQPTADHDR